MMVSTLSHEFADPAPQLPDFHPEAVAPATPNPSQIPTSYPQAYIPKRAKTEPYVDPELEWDEILDQPCRAADAYVIAENDYAEPRRAYKPEHGRLSRAARWIGARATKAATWTLDKLDPQLPDWKRRHTAGLLAGSLIIGVAVGGGVRAIEEQPIETGDPQVAAVSTMLVPTTDRLQTPKADRSRDPERASYPEPQPIITQELPKPAVQVTEKPRVRTIHLRPGGTVWGKASNLYHQKGYDRQYKSVATFKNKILKFNHKSEEQALEITPEDTIKIPPLKGRG